mgnify:CR=1 FL=1
MRGGHIPKLMDEPLKLNGADENAMEVFTGLTKFHRLHSKALYHFVAQRELFHAQMFYLKAISQNEGISQSRLADMAGVERASVTAALQRMEKAGYIVRRPDKEDQRKTRLYLSEKGRQLNYETDEALSNYVNQCYCLNENEAKNLLAVINKINRLISEYLSEVKEEEKD